MMTGAFPCAYTLPGQRLVGQLAPPTARPPDGAWGDRWRAVGLGNLAAAVAALTVGVAGCSNSVIKNSAGGGAPGVSSTEIDVGSIANVTGPLSSGFAPLVNGVQAYFSMINAQGGVAGRKLKLAYQEDDQGSPTVDLTVAQQLVEQDHVFAVVGVGTPFFGGASYLAQQGTPTFGYVVSTDWENKPTLFGDYGSVLDFATAAPGDAYVAQQLGAKSIAVVAYGVAQSSAACQAAVTGMRALGLNVVVQRPEPRLRRRPHL